MRKWINLFEEVVAHRVVAPDVGTIVQVDDPTQFNNSPSEPKGKRTYRVSSWMKAAPEPKFDMDKVLSDDDEGEFDRWMDHQRAGATDGIGDIVDSSARRFNDNKRLMWCTREEAEYLVCSGVAGALIKVQDAQVVGRVNWSEEQINSARASALRKVGQMLY